MALPTETSPDSTITILSDINLACTAVFVIECICKLIAYNIKGYFHSGWNKFDFFVVCASILDFILGLLGNGLSFLKVGPQLARILRITRLLRLVRQLRSLQKLIQVAVLAIPSVMNGLALLVLAFFIFAILAVFLF